MSRPDIPAADLASAMVAFGWADATATPIEVGLINATFRIGSRDGPIAVLQRLHPVFDPEVNLGIDAVTSHLVGKGVQTPTLLRTESGEPWFQSDDWCWRALSWVEGVTVEKVPGPAWAEAAGEVCGRFHAALSDLNHDFAFVRTGVHDTASHLARLRTVMAAPADESQEWLAEAAALGAEILGAADGLQRLSALPTRVCHGDLKISNIMFDEGPPPRGLCLVDLDTVGMMMMAHELGDALRSWCNRAGESSPNPEFDLELLAAAVKGYKIGSGSLLSVDEWQSIATGVETICVELAARFCSDVFVDEYFGWDATRYSCRRDHNLVRAKNQLGLSRSVRRQHAEITRLLA